MDRRTYLKKMVVASGGLLLPLGVLSVVGRHGVSSAPGLIGFNGKIMGTGYSVRLDAHSAAFRNITELELNTKLQSLAAKVHSELQNIDANMSTWRDDSEVVKFNNSVDADWQQLNSSTLAVVQHALHMSKLSAGAFDATVAPLVDLWGFGASTAHARYKTTYRKPSTEAVSTSLQKIGFNAIEIDQRSNAIRKLNSETQLDLSGIAKGYAVDKVANLLNKEGFNNYLVEVGGELYSQGVKPDGGAWKVAIESPINTQRNPFRVINLKDNAIATSGDYRNFYINSGQRYSHSIDPRTGKPVRHDLASVSVIRPTTMEADALSTALMIMGPEDAMDFAQQHKIAAHLISRSADGVLQEKYSQAFASYIG